MQPSEPSDVWSETCSRRQGCLTEGYWEGAQKRIQEREILTVSTRWLYVAALGSGSLGHCLLTVAQRWDHIYPHSLSGEAAQPLPTF